MKKLLAAALAAILLLALTACSAAPAGNTPAPAQETPAAETTPEIEGELKVLRVGASPAPHAQILEFVKPMLLEQGIDLQIEIFTDYVLPNTALEAGELDANYFQHGPYLEEFNESRGTHLISAAAVHFEPLGIYAGRSSDLTQIADGAEIAVPNDPTNEARALKLLERYGILTVDPEAENATAQDILENPHNVRIIETEAAQVPRTLEDVDFAVANGNYALEAEITDRSVTLTDENGETVYATEDASGEQAQTYANILAVREGDASREEIQALAEALTSDETREYIVSTFGASVIPVL